MSEKNLKYILGISGAVLAVVLCLFYIPKISFHNVKDVHQIDTWYYIDEYGIEQRIHLPDVLHPDQEGTIEIYTQLPEGFVNEQILCFWTYYQAVEVYIDNEQIYYFDNSKTDSFGKAPSSQWNYVDTSGHVDGKILKIRMSSPYRNINNRLSEVLYGHMDDIGAWMQGTFGLQRVLENLLFAAGLVFIIISFVRRSSFVAGRAQLFFGVYVVIVSIYLRTTVRGMPSYLMGNYLKDFLCYFCLMTLSIPFTLYTRVRNFRWPVIIRICDVLLSFECVIAVFAFMLHGLGLKDMHEMMPIGMITLLVSVLVSLGVAMWYMIKKLVPNRISIPILMSSILLLGILAVEYMQFYWLNTLSFEAGFVSRVGIMLYVLIETYLYLLMFYMEERKKEALVVENNNLKLQMLTSQIRPHFILNTIGAIRNLILDDPQKAYDSLYDFSRYIRKNLEQKDYTKEITFPEELDYINTYLKLEQARFGTKLQIEYDFETEEFWVLPLVIQPFVENAVKHGIFQCKDGGTLKLSTKRAKDKVVIRIIDNGVGFDASNIRDKMEEGKSVGIRSAIWRIEKGLNGTCDIKSSMDLEDHGTCVEIVLPIRKGKKK